MDLPLLLDQSNGALLMLGAPGAGKTTAALSLVRSLLEHARRHETAPAPVVLNLASFNSKSSLVNWLESEIVTKYRLPRQRVSRMLDSDDLVLVLDGLDEIGVKHRSACIEAINEFRRERPVPVVVACREPEYVASPVRLALGSGVRLQPLHAADATAWGIDPEKLDALADKDERLLTPLWLTLAAARGIDDLEDEAAWETVFQAYIDDALARPPKLGEAERARELKRLTWLAANLGRLGESDIWLERIQYEWLPGIGRQMLAMALGMLFIALASVIPPMVGSVIVGRSALSGFILGLASISIALSFNSGLRVQTGERLGWRWQTALRRIPLMTSIGATIGLVYSLAMGRPWQPMLYLGGTGGAAVGIILGLDYADKSRGLMPADSLRLALRQSIFVAAFTGVTAGLLYRFVIAPPYVQWFPRMVDAYPNINVPLMYGVQLGALLAGAIGLLYGGAAVLLHAAYRIVLAATTPLPLRLVPWLDAMTRRGLMRRVGGGYMFIHETLQDSLAKQRR